MLYESIKLYAQPPNDPKLSDGKTWPDGCAGEGGGAASVKAGAVRCSAWLNEAACAARLSIERVKAGGMG